MATSRDTAGSSGVRQRKPSFGASAMDAAQSLEHAVSDTLLQLWDDLPAWRRDNGYIHGGYRQIRGSYGHAARSLLYLHNESVNIWSHLLGAVGAVASAVYVFHVVRPRYREAHAGDVAVFACFFGGAVVCLGMSATFHAVLDHSQAVAKWGNKLDYTGIVALIVGSYVPALYYGFFCQPLLFKAYLYVVRAPAAVFRPPLTRNPLTKKLGVDVRSGRGLRDRLLGRALPHVGLASLPRRHVCRPGRVGHRAHPPRHPHPRLPVL